MDDKGQVDSEDEVGKGWGDGCPYLRVDAVKGSVRQVIV